jgi:hypothetical protein
LQLSDDSKELAFILAVCLPIDLVKPLV